LACFWLCSRLVRFCKPRARRAVERCCSRPRTTSAAWPRWWSPTTHPSPAPSGRPTPGAGRGSTRKRAPWSTWGSAMPPATSRRWCRGGATAAPPPLEAERRASRIEARAAARLRGLPGAPEATLRRGSSLFPLA